MGSLNPSEWKSDKVKWILGGDADPCAFAGPPPIQDKGTSRDGCRFARFASGCQEGGGSPFSPRAGLRRG